MEVDKTNEQDFLKEVRQRNEAQTKLDSTAKEEFYGGTDKVKIEGRDPSPFYPGASPTVEEMYMKDVPRYVLDKVREAKQDGTVPTTLRRYAGQLKGMVTYDKHAALRNIADRVWNSRHDDAAVELGRKEFMGIVGKLRIQGRK